MKTRERQLCYRISSLITNMNKNYLTSLTRAQRLELSLSAQLKAILVGLILGALYIEKAKGRINARLRSAQGTVHEDYLRHLYGLFQSGTGPKISNITLKKREGIVYSKLWFGTYSLPCFTNF